MSLDFGWLLKLYTYIKLPQKVRIVRQGLRWNFTKVLGYKNLGWGYNKTGFHCDSRFYSDFCGFNEIYIDINTYIYYGRGTLKWVAYNPIMAIVAREMMINHQIWYLFLFLYRKSKCLRVAESKSKPNHCYFLRGLFIEIYSFKVDSNNILILLAPVRTN